MLSRLDRPETCTTGTGLTSIFTSTAKSGWNNPFFPNHRKFNQFLKQFGSSIHQKWLPYFLLLLFCLSTQATWTEAASETPAGKDNKILKLLPKF